MEQWKGTVMHIWCCDLTIIARLQLYTRKAPYLVLVQHLMCRMMIYIFVLEFSSYVCRYAQNGELQGHRDACFEA